MDWVELLKEVGPGGAVLVAIVIVMLKLGSKILDKSTELNLARFNSELERNAYQQQVMFATTREKFLVAIEDVHKRQCNALRYIRYALRFEETPKDVVVRAWTLVSELEDSLDASSIWLEEPLALEVDTYVKRLTLLALELEMSRREAAGLLKDPKNGIDPKEVIPRLRAELDNHEHIHKSLVSEFRRALRDPKSIEAIPAGED